MTDTPPDTGTETPEPTPDATEPEGTETEPEVDWKAEAEKFKALHRKQEERAKANANAAKELEQLRQATMSDTEKAVEIARQQARAEALAELGGELVSEAIRAAVAGRGVDPDALLEGLDPTRFITEDGRPDRDAITAWVDRIAPKSQNGFPDLGQGARNVPLGGDKLEQLLRQSINPH